VIGEKNLRSQRAVQKIGATLRGSIERAGSTGEVRPNLVFEISRARWAARTPGS
jgi:RimJ/RimL family protein N-acetyltransferase